VFSELCYAEFASMVGLRQRLQPPPIGELVAWIIGWDLILECALTSTVAVGCRLLRQLMHDLGVDIDVARDRAVESASPVIVLVVTTLLVTGSRNRRHEHRARRHQSRRPRRLHRRWRIVRADGEFTPFIPPNKAALIVRVEGSCAAPA
jgi:hypothetical protein